MNATETMKDRCERCDCERLESVVRAADVIDARHQALLAELREKSGAPDSSALLAEMRAQLEEARRERDTMRATADAAGKRIAELRAELSEDRVSAEQGVLVAKDLEEKLRKEREAGLSLRASLVEAAAFARDLVEEADCQGCREALTTLADCWERQAKGTP